MFLFFGRFRKLHDCTVASCLIHCLPQNLFLPWYKQLHGTTQESNSYQVISVAHAMSTHCVRRKHQKNLWFLSPTQFPSQGQWWSYRRTQRPQSSQCLARNGCNIAQYPQRRNLDPPRGGVAKILQDSSASSPSDWLSESRCSASDFFKKEFKMFSNIIF